MKSKILILISLVIILCGGIAFTFKDTYVSKEDIPNFLEDKLKEMGFESIDVKHEKNLNNKYIIVFTYKDKNSSSEYIGVSTFEIKSHNRYKYEKLNRSSLDINENTVTTIDEQGSLKVYAIFYGIIRDGIPNKYKVTHSGKTQIEEISRNEFFIKYYLIGDSNGVKIVPHEDNN